MKESVGKQSGMECMPSPRGSVLRDLPVCRLSPLQVVS